MKAIQVVMEEDLLRRFDADAEVRRDGRSAVLRRAVAEYLRRRRRAAISDAYRRAYGGRGKPLARELEGWSNEGVWPDE